MCIGHQLCAASPCVNAASQAGLEQACSLLQAVPGTAQRVPALLPVWDAGKLRCSPCHMHHTPFQGLFRPMYSLLSC